jgi:hypothetical protein
MVAYDILALGIVPGRERAMDTICPLAHVAIQEKLRFAVKMSRRPRMNQMSRIGKAH